MTVKANRQFHTVPCSDCGEDTTTTQKHLPASCQICDRLKRGTSDDYIRQLKERRQRYRDLKKLRELEK